MSMTSRGKMHGKTIELEQNPGLAEGQEVEVEIKPVQPQQAWGEGIRRSAGAWKELPELDKIFEQIQQDRKLERRTVEEEV
jgi:hypothetical protein